MAGVGTKMVFEDDPVIAWYLDLEPGEQGSRHTHELDCAAYIICCDCDLHIQENRS